MPKLGVSTEWLETREDEIARILTAREHVERIRALGRVLAQRRAITRKIRRPCPHCSGTGRHWNKGWRRCAPCRGTGMIELEAQP